MLEQITVGKYIMYESARFIPQLRAWVEQGSGYILAEIWGVENGKVTYQEIGAGVAFVVPVSQIHCVHEYYPHTNTVKIYGEPKNKAAS